MSWIQKFKSSSIGRKQIVAITGLLLCGFLITHLAGNLLLFAGFDPETGACAFNDYAAKLTGNKPLLYIAEIILFSIFATHVYFAINLNMENSAARGPVPYHVDTDAGEITFASKYMKYTGIFIMIFIVVHLANFKFAEQGPKGLYGVVEDAFQSPLWSVFYIVSMFIISLHLRHGVKSVFQTLGLNHKKYNDIFDNISLGFAGIIFVGFSSFPVYFFLKGVAS